ncbi:MAG TPA: alpha/beta fold hydrolase [Burkholderiales bacterium]|nr:alpha/beta fold hydrolase [Burkholderiales bacterium]
MQQSVAFTSAGLRLTGVLHLPADHAAGERRATIVVMHGFGSTKDAGNVLEPVKLLTSWGYAALRFDFRGCGESEGEPGRVICMEEVDDARAAVGFLRERPEVDPRRIALAGSSFGAAVAIYAGATDERVAAVISSGGWGDGERKFRGQHPTPEAWAAFTRMLAEGREHRARTGKSLRVPRYDIVPIPEHLRNNVTSKSSQEFPAETPQSMMEFKADDVVARIAPRPLLLLHSAHDSVTPTAESIELFRRARPPVELHLFDGVDHFMLREGSPRVVTTLRDWLAAYFPVIPAPAARPPRR